MAGHLNVELKARCADPARVRRILEAAGAEFRGLDRQRDVYFNVVAGRLKLRRGTIERSLVHYHRVDAAAVKRSEVTLARLEALTTPELDAIEAALTAGLGVATVVEKAREIHFVGNVKFHLDEVPGLGSFVELEAIDLDDSRGEAELRAQCEEWRARLAIKDEDLLAHSYCDLIGDATLAEPVSSTPRRS